MTPEKLSQDAAFAAEFGADVGAERIATLYAEAFLAAAEADGSAAEAVETLISLVDDVVAKFPDFQDVLGSILISHDEKCEVIDHVFGAKAPPLVVDFLKVLSKHGRLDCLHAVRRAAESLWDEKQGRVLVELTTPVPVDEETAFGDREKPLDKLHAKSVVERKVDPAMIGGAILRVGDTIYDNSVAAQLQLIRKRMINRSVHEIQSGRNRFSYPAGN